MAGQTPQAIATLELDAKSPILSGTLSGGFGPPLEFSGWAELAAAIEQWRTQVRADEQSEQLAGSAGRSVPGHVVEARLRSARCADPTRKVPRCEQA
jgi:hypothetical protein